MYYLFNLFIIIYYLLISYYYYYYYLKQNHGETSGNIGHGLWINIMHHGTCLGLASMYQDSQTQINAEIAFVCSGVH